MKINTNDFNSAELIKSIRDSTYLTQKDFGARVGKSERTIQEYEAGRTNYSFNFLIEVAKTFDILITIEKE